METEANSPTQSENRHEHRRKKSRRHESADKKSARSLHVPLELSQKELNQETDRPHKKKKNHNRQEHQPKQPIQEHELRIKHGETEPEPQPEPAPKPREFESQTFQLRDAEPEPKQTPKQPTATEARQPEPETSEPFSIDEARRQVDQQILEDAKNIPEPQTHEVPYEPYASPSFTQPLEQPRTETATTTPPMPEEKQPLPPDHRLEHSVWHSIEVDNKSGHAVEKPTAEYGDAYQAEHRPETHNSVSYEPPEAAIASGQLAVDHTAAEDSSSRSSMLPIASTQRIGYSNRGGRYQEALRNLGPIIDSNMGDFLLWIVLIVIIIAIIIVLVA